MRGGALCLCELVCQLKEAKATQFISILLQIVNDHHHIVVEGYSSDARSNLVVSIDACSLAFLSMPDILGQDTNKKLLYEYMWILDRQHLSIERKKCLYE